MRRPGRERREAGEMACLYGTHTPGWAQTSSAGKHTLGLLILGADDQANVFHVQRNRTCQFRASKGFSLHVPGSLLCAYSPGERRLSFYPPPPRPSQQRPRAQTKHHHARL